MPVPAQRRPTLRQMEQKWSPTLIKAGWTVIPNVLLERQKAFGLDAVDDNILLHLIRHWWFHDRLPHPSKRTIAECMGIHPSTVRRRIKKMEAAGFIQRQPRFDPRYGQETNHYDFSGLIGEAKPFAQEIIDTRSKRRDEDEQRRGRKRPALHVGGGKQ
jgi:hypothetical protein